MQVSLEMIEEFLACKRLAMVGLSRNPRDFSARLFEEFLRQGYDIVPVNPNAAEIQGKVSYPRVQDIQPPPQAALLMTSPAVTDAVVRDCAQVGIGRIWMYQAGGLGAVSSPALQFCREQGMRVVAGECPFMFLSEAGGIHRFHGFLRKILRSYPRRMAA